MAVVHTNAQIALQEARKAYKGYSSRAQVPEAAILTLTEKFHKLLLALDKDDPRVYTDGE